MHFQSVNYKADKKLKDFAKKRIEKLSLFYNQIIEVFVFTKVENNSDGINKWTELFTFDYTLANAFILGWLSSGTCYLLGVLINDFGFKVTFKNEGDCHHD